MIIEVIINGETRFRWPVNINAGNQAKTWETKVQYREDATAMLLKKVREEIIPNLNDIGKVEVFLIFSADFPVEQESPVHKMRPIILRTPPPDPIRHIPESPLFPDSKPKFQRPPAEYSNKQYAQNL